MKTIVFARQATKQFDTLPGDAQASIEAALSQYAISGRGDVKRLTGIDASRMRVGDYRILFSESEGYISVVFVGRRTTTTYH
jgi:mRNA interferase RelE/StbE